MRQRSKLTDGVLRAQPEDFVGRRIVNINVEAVNAWRIEFDDGRGLSIEAVMVRNMPMMGVSPDPTEMSARSTNGGASAECGADNHDQRTDDRQYEARLRDEIAMRVIAARLSHQHFGGSGALVSTDQAAGAEVVFAYEIADLMIAHRKVDE